ncbi:MAG: O-antigen ligase family protein [Bacteroidales bacterium]|nr:O-antigen ligase family protein [Bacteroidales bacterium]
MRLVFYLLYFIVGIGCVFLNTDLFFDAKNQAKEYIFLTGLSIGLLGWGLFLVKTNSHLFPKLSSRFLMMICLTISILESSYSVIDFLLNGRGFVGSFDNEAGLSVCLISTMPFAQLLYVGNKSRMRFYLFLITAIILSTPIIVMRSRTGIIAILVLLTVIFLGRVKITKLLKVAIFSLIILVSIFGLYFMKKDSADGRLLIWRCSLELIAKKPIFGHGRDGFTANYMSEQAKWNSRHLSDKITYLAGDTTEPFNEYIRIMVNHGFVGLLLFAFIIFHLYLCWKHDSYNLCTKLSAFSIFLILVCAMFSYPFKYPFTWYVLFINCYTLFNNNFYIQSLRSSRYLRLSLVASSIVAATLIICHLISDIPAQLKWRKLESDFVFLNQSDVFEQFASLEKQLGTNRLFLYSYSAALFSTNQYRECLILADKCRSLWEGYDLEIMTASCYDELCCYEKAEYHYMQSYFMCPCRFLPLYKLMLLYQENGEIEKSKNIARCILEKRVKIHSPSVDTIKEIAKSILN